MPESAPAAPAAPAAPSATVVTPAAPSPVPTSPSPKPAQVPRAVERKVYNTRAAPSKPAVVATTPAAPASVPTPVTETAAESGAPTGVDPAKVPGAADEASAEAAPLTESEAVKRLARLHRTEARLSAEKQTLSQERQTFAQERAQYAQALERVKTLEAAAGAAQKDPLAVLRSLGIHPQHVLDAILGDTAKPAAQRQQETLTTLEQKLANYEKEMKAAQESAKAREQDAQVQQHIAAKIAPVLADGYPYLKYAASLQGLDLGRELYKAQYDHYQKTGVVLEAKALADEAEARHAEKAATLLGVNAKPKQPASPSGSAPPKEKPGAPAKQPLTPAVRQRTKPAYAAKVVAR